jgi:tripartite-type tricarboxylate transporter receptor subunit TctC
MEAVQRRHILLAAAAVPIGRAAAAQTQWPERTVRLFVGFAPGTAADNIARVVADALQAVLGQPVVIENRVGAQGTLAAGAVARAAADGYSVLMGSGTSHGAASALLRNVPYDPIADFVPVMRLAHITQVLVVRADHPARDLGGFLAWLREAPKPVQWGQGSSGNLYPAAALLRHLGIANEMISYRSPPQALTDLIGGRFPFMFVDLSAGIGAIRGGQIRPLAISSHRPSPHLPGVPTLDAAVPGFSFETWFGVYLPAGTPSAVVERLAAALRTVMAREEVWARLSPMGFEASPGSAADLLATTRAEIARWQAAVRDFGIDQQ